MPAGPGSVVPVRDLAPVIPLYRDALTALGVLREWPLDGFDRTGIPVVAASWADPTDATLEAYGVGYGSTWEQATIGALGETAERVVLGFALRHLPRRTATLTELTREFGSPAVADPLTLTLPAGSDHHPAQIRQWVPATRWRTGEKVWVPVEFAAAEPSALPAGYQPLITPISNGLGAGDTLVRAVGHGLLELLQRDGDTVSFRALDQGIELDLSGLTDPTALDALARLRAAGIEPMVKLAGTEFVPVVYVAGADPDPGRTALAASAVGEAAHPDTETAVAKALLEYASSRARRAFAFGPFERVRQLLPQYAALEEQVRIGPQEDRALRAMTDWVFMPPDRLAALVAPVLLRSIRTVPVVDLPAAKDATSGDPAALLSRLLQLLAEFDVLVVAGESGGIHAAKVIVPSLEVETLSYSRIGERVARRLLDRDSPLVGRGLPDRPTRLPIIMNAAATVRLGGPVWLDQAEVDRTVGPLYPLYREPRRHAVQRFSLAPPTGPQPAPSVS